MSLSEYGWQWTHHCNKPLSKSCKLCTQLNNSTTEIQRHVRERSADPLNDVKILVSSRASFAQ